jgi:hypothetical protein
MLFGAQKNKGKKDICTSPSSLLEVYTSKFRTEPIVLNNHRELIPLWNQVEIRSKSTLTRNGIALSYSGVDSLYISFRWCG